LYYIPGKNPSPQQTDSNNPDENESGC